MQLLAIAAQLGSVLTGLSIIFLALQLTKELRHQNLQSLFYLHQYLSQEEFSRSRHVIRTELFSKAYAQWNENDKRIANKVCASYDQAGMLIAAGILNRQTRSVFLSSSWGESICDQFESLREYLNDKQTPSRTGKDFFCHFCDLYKEASTYHR